MIFWVVFSFLFSFISSWICYNKGFDAGEKFNEEKWMTAWTGNFEKFKQKLEK